MAVPVDVDANLLRDPLGTRNNFDPGQDVSKKCALYFEVDFT
jgi:hypothetical protein